MALALECISIVIPITKLKKCRDIADVDAFLRDVRENAYGVWFDYHIIRFPGGMEQMAVMEELNYWKAQGLMITRKYKSELHWQDVCVVDAFSGPTLPCRWLDHDPEQSFVWYAGTEPGKTVMGCMV
jgi:hypothetical protein